MYVYVCDICVAMSAMYIYFSDVLFCMYVFVCDVCMYLFVILYIMCVLMS